MSLKGCDSSRWNVSERAAALHADAVVCDMTLPWMPGYENQDTTLPRYAASGASFVSLSVGHDRFNLAATLHHIADVKATLRRQADSIVFVKTVEDILRAKNEGKLAVGFNSQGTEGLEGDKNLIEVFYDLGVRHMLFAYNQKNRAADGCHERTDCGLSRYGIKLVEEMNRVGMIVDLSHTGYKSTMDAIEVSEAPVIFSHSNAYALQAHPRNIRDDQIEGCARKGGVIGINGLGFFLGNNDISTENVLRHVDYIAQLVGPEHVGIGLDFVYFEKQMYRMFVAYPERFPEGYPSKLEDWKYFPPERLPEIT